MSNIQKYKSDLPAITTGWLILSALASPMVNDADPFELFNVLNIAIAKSYVDTGYRAPDAKNDNERSLYENMVNELVVYIRVKLATYRLDEIPIAIGNGCVGEYGDFTGLNKKSYIQFLNGYKNSEDRAKKLAEHNAKVNTPTPPPSIEKQYQTAKYNTGLALWRFRNNEPMDRFGGAVYDFLNSLGLINYDKETKLKIFSQATARVVDYYQSQKVHGNFFERQQLSNLINQFQLGPDPATKEYNLIVSTAKVMTLKLYFEDSIEANANIEALIDSRKELFIQINQNKDNE